MGGGQLQVFSSSGVAWKTGKWHVLMDASYCIHWARNPQKWEGKLTENGTKYQQTGTGMKEKVQLTADTCISQNTQDRNICGCVSTFTRSRTG